MKFKDFEKIVDIFEREHYTREDAEHLAKTVIALVNAAKLNDQTENEKGGSEL